MTTRFRQALNSGKFVITSEIGHRKEQIWKNVPAY